MGARGAWVGVAVAIAALGCGGDDKTPTAAGPAGSVTELEGTASATRGEPAETRDLAVGATVFSDDVIKTAADSRIAVSLTHNGAVWQLGANLERRVDKSGAWRAPKGSTDESALAARRDDDRTMVAGRHGEKAAAETADTAGRAPAADKLADEGDGAGERAVATAAPVAAPPPRAKAAPRPKRKSKPKTASTRGYKSQSGSGRAGVKTMKKKGYGVVAAPAPTGDAKRSRGGGGAMTKKDAKTASDSDALTESARAPAKVKLGARTMSAQLLVRGAVKHCQRTLAKSTAGKVSVTVDVGADGKLKVVSLTSSTNKLKEVLGCARKRLTNARAEKPKKPGKLRLTITLK